MENMTKIHTECVLAFEHFQRMNSTRACNSCPTPSSDWSTVLKLTWISYTESTVEHLTLNDNIKQIQVK